MLKAVILVLSIVLVIDIGYGLWLLIKIDQLKRLLRYVLYNLRRTDGDLPHDKARINHCIIEIQKVVTE